MTDLSNGFRYIGITGLLPEWRFVSHFRANKGQNNPIANATRNRHFSEFSLTVLHENLTKEQAENTEATLITELKPEYNIAPGGKSRGRIKGTKLSAESRAKISASKRGKPSKIKWTDELKALHRERLAGYSEAKKKPIRCLTTGKIYSSGVDAALELGIHKSVIRAVASGRRNSVYGRKFEYVQQ